MNLLEYFLLTVAKHSRYFYYYPFKTYTLVYLCGAMANWICYDAISPAAWCCGAERLQYVRDVRGLVPEAGGYGGEEVVVVLFVEVALVGTCIFVLLAPSYSFSITEVADFPKISETTESNATLQTVSAF